MSRKPTHYWSGLPVYRCRFCRFELVKHLARVESHEREVHGTQPRKSVLVGPKGEALVIEARIDESVDSGTTRDVAQANQGDGRSVGTLAEPAERPASDAGMAEEAGHSVGPGGRAAEPGPATAKAGWLDGFVDGLIKRLEK